jgi:hypothetical protein
LRSIVFAIFLTGCGSCEKNPAVPAEGGDAFADAILAPPPRSAEIERLWSEANDGGEDELARLANEEGPAGLEERAADPNLRSTALAAMGYTKTLSGLALLGESAAHDPEPLAIIAARSAEMLASNPRRSRDPEDALEVHQGCDRLRSAANDTARPKTVRDSAARAVRMLSDLCAP